MPQQPPALPVRLSLRAIDPTRNIARGYSIDALPDLFGHWIVDLHWGRIGTRGLSRTVSFAAPKDAARFVRATLSKRESAKRRIGVGYQAV